MEIHQLLAGANLGDAITNEALELQALLRTAMRSEIFACHPHPSVSGLVHHLNDYERHHHSPASRTLLLLHMSISEPQLFDFVMRHNEDVVVRYHNITPPHFFEGYSASFVSLLERGRVELASLSRRAVMAIADSHYNEGELREAGYRRTAVVPLLIRVASLLATPDPEKPAIDTPRRGEGPMILFVGRIAPNKGHIHMLKALHVLRTYLQPDAHMYFAGGGEVFGYLVEIRRYARDLGLRPVLTGKITDADLATLYRRADVFLSMSEHEGFGAPLVEAMAFDVPVVAYAATAVGETVGDAGILIDHPDPLLAAEAVSAVCDDAELRAELTGRGRRRWERFAPQRVGAELVGELLELV